MKRAIPAVLFVLAFAPPASAPATAPGLSGSWAFTTGDLQPAQRCTLSGAVVIQPLAADEEKHQCRISAVFRCEKQPGKQLVMEQSCTASFLKDSVWINGLTVQIVEAVPEGWRQPWEPDDFLLVHNRNFTRMSGRIGTKTVATFTRIPDLRQ